MITIIKKYKLLFISLFAYVITGFYNSEIFMEALSNTGVYLKEMLEVLPAVFILSSLIDAWVPRQVILNNFGKDSGLKGKFFSVFIGSVSAGPIYAAFPVTRSLLKKGATVSNSVIIISAWAVVKIPMLLVETRFLGIRFAGVRYVLTVPAIIMMGIICEKLIGREGVLEVAKKETENDKVEEINEILPGYNCGSCGYKSCYSYAEALGEGNEADRGKCYPGGEEVVNELGKLDEVISC